MKTTVRALVLLASAAVVVLPLAGCGGGAGGGATVSVEKMGTVPWVARQDGAGAWQELSGTSFTVSDAGGRYGVAWECTQGSGQPLVGILQATTAENTIVTASCPAAASSASTYSVSGNLQNVPSFEDAFVAAGSSTTAVPFTNSTENYYVGSVPVGEQTILAYPLTNGGGFGNMVRTTVNVVANMILVDLDLSTGEAVATSNSLSLSNVPASETPGLVVDLAPAATPPVTLAASASKGLSYPLVPTGESQAGDTYVLIGSGVGSNVAQVAAVVSRSPTSGASFALPSALSASAGVLVNGPTATAIWGPVTFSTSSGLGLSDALVAPRSLTSPVWTVVATSGWLGTDVSYTFPDFSATSGWNSNWDFPTGQPATASVLVSHANLTMPTLHAFLQTRDYGGLPNGTSVEVTSESATGTY